jgi:subtilase family serine protease
MKTLLALARQRRLWLCGWIAASSMVASQLGAQSVAPRITSEIANSELTTLHGSLHPLAQPQFDTGRMPADTRLNGVSIVFSRTPEQEADLQALITEQQDPASPLYHQWLTPDQFAARFGVADADLAKVTSWLQQQGFSIDSVARSRNMVRFSGSSGQVEQAFATEMHTYNLRGEQHIAPSTELSIPAALSSIVLSVGNLSDFRPHPMLLHPAQPEFTSSQSGAVHFAPSDIKIAYDIPSAYTGLGQSIAIMGQSAILTSDITNFQSASGLANKAPTMVLVPGTGSSAIYKGDESESDIDLEWSGAIATGANIVFVYVGSSFNYDVSDSIQYAVDQDIAPIISVSYGYCETQVSNTFYNAMELIGSQAATQGQTIVASSGDSGSTGCSGFTGLSAAQHEALAVSYPASSAYVTAAGGTEITAANDVAGTPPGYWTAATTADVLTSAIQWIPEVAWNDDALGNGLSSSGGGVSTLVPRPSWQAGTIAGQPIPAGTKRLVPDIALYSSPNYPGYLFCSSDPSEVSGSCSNGFRDSNSKYLTVAGGTSFAAPIFAGMVALINQAKGYTSGQGLVNPTLYTLAASANYSTAFHDITSGNNNCTGSSSLCGSPATGGFAAGTGYDQVTGLGSVNLTNLIGAWTPPPTPVIPTLVGTNTSISAATLSPAASTSDTITITVVSANGVTPTGNVKLSIDGGGTAYSNSGFTTTAALAATSTPGTATATYSASFATTGSHQIIAQFPGSGTFALSTAAIQLTVGGTSSGVGTFTIAPSNTSAGSPTLTVTSGTSGNETITITPAGGYTGTVLMGYNTSNNTALANLCVFATYVTNSYASLQVPSGVTNVATTLTFDTKATDCYAAAPVGSTPLRILSRTTTSKNNAPNPAPLGVAFAGVLLIGFLSRRARSLRNLAGIVLLFGAALAVTSCGSSTPGGNNNTITNPAAGTYTITINAHDSVTTSITASTSFTLTIQ